MKLYKFVFVFVLVFGFVGVSFGQIEPVSTGTNTPNPASVYSVGVNNESPMGCVVGAVLQREEKIIGAFEIFSQATLTALNQRNQDLNQAWNKEVATERQTARTQAWSKYKTSVNQAKKTFRSAKKLAWTDFKKASAVCKVKVVESETNDLLSL